MTAPGTGEALLAYLGHRLERYLGELRELCSIDSPTAYKPGVDLAGDWVRAWAEARGWDVRIRPDASRGNSLTVSLPGGTRRGSRIVMAAHLDTVYPVGTAAARPLARDGDALLGPGVADNKSGLLSGLYAMAALEDEDLLEPFSHVTLFCGGDEETDMESSLSVLREVAPETDAAFVLEAGRENGDIVGARKTSATYVLQVQGHEAHAGVEPHKGANAILALAQKIVALHGLNGMRPGVTVNVGVAAGGTLPNVVPGHAAAQIDVRAERAEDMQPVGDAITAVAAASLVPGTRTTLDGGWKAPPMPETPQTAALARLAAASAAELGFTVRAASTGGISYANHLAGLGIPVLDGLGPIGGLDHSPQEYISVASIVPRTALLALLMLRTAEHGRQFA